MTDAERSTTFLSNFNAERAAISKQIDELQSKGALTAQGIQPISARLNQLSSTLIGALAFLPGYDQRLCNQNIKQLEVGVDLLRQKLPKSRFAFKKKLSPAAATPVSDSPPPSTPALSSSDTRSSTPQTRPTTSFRVSDKKRGYINLDDFETPNSSLAPASSKVDNEPRDIILTSLEGCVIDLLPCEGKPMAITALYGRGLMRCVIMAALVQGSVRLEDCVDCQIVVGCHQFRMEQCISTDVYLNVSSLPVIEQSNSLRFAGYPDGLASRVSLIISNNNLHNDVKDFSWIKATASPNWSTLQAADAIDWVMELDGTRENSFKKPSEWVVDMTARLTQRTK
ncbi:hypothetical protein FRB97_002932 [Tulasnella sp. 331]|nr:hypothetical protein FRB97_002932 [Tulasnella sp. 331]KAG8886894.1 hypothetical protein FRB98_000810 [Tulasnella sp. 332]